MLDATKVDDFVDALLRHAGNSLNAAVADTAADMVSVLNEWLTEKELAHLGAHIVAAASKLKNTNLLGFRARCGCLRIV